MSKFYFKAIPVRCGLTGYEMLAGFLDGQFPGVKFQPVVSDGIAEFGILTGEGDIFAKAMSAIEGRFSAVRVTEDVFIGVVARYYTPMTDPMNMMVPMTLDEYLTSLGITPPADSLANVKQNKKQLLKEITKKKFSDDNDLIADLCKCVALLSLHYSTLTAGEKTTVDALSTTLKTIYSKDVCISAYSSMVGTLSTILVDYYAVSSSVDAAADIAAVDAIEIV